MPVSFQEKIKVFSELLLNPKELSALISLKHSGYLASWGWFNAFNSKSSVGINNEPLPWVTYPFIAFIKPRLSKDLDVFEFGSGNSTLFYSKYVRKVTSAEHSKEWYNKMLSAAPKNVELMHIPEGPGYSESINRNAEKYDIIVVDAIDRVECIHTSLDHLSNNGVLILDDSEREEYTPGKEFMKEKDFKNIEFWGISPGYLMNKCTTVYYKDSNCLGI